MNQKDLAKLMPGDKVRFKKGDPNAGMQVTVMDILKANPEFRFSMDMIKITGCGEDRWVSHHRLAKA